MATTILSNVGNAAFALPMVQAYPVDVNLQYLLGWNPTQQALDYIPITVNSSGDLTVTRDLAVTRNAQINGTLGVNGVLTTLLAAPAVIPALVGPVVVSGTPNINLNSAAGQIQVNGTKTLGARQTGWAAMTGTPQRTTAATGTVTLPQLAGIVMALQADLITHGIIGP